MRSVSRRLLCCVLTSYCRVIREQWYFTIQRSFLHYSHQCTEYTGICTFCPKCNVIVIFEHYSYKAVTSTIGCQCIIFWNISNSIYLFLLLWFGKSFLKGMIFGSDSLFFIHLGCCQFIQILFWFVFVFLSIFTALSHTSELVKRCNHHSQYVYSL